MNELIKQRIAAVRRGEVPEGYQQINGYIIPRNWHLEPLSNKFMRSFRKNDSACDNVLTISAQLGLVSQKEYYDKDIASEDKSGYYLLKKGEFAYNKSYSTGYPFGAIKRLEKYETGIVSPLYICFTPLKETNASFYAQYFEAGLYNREIYRFAQEGARNHGLLNISTEDFFAGDLAVPPEEEQRKIAEILSVCDRIIARKQELVGNLQNLKKACLAKLFPQSGFKVPKLRFPGFTAPWEQRKLCDVTEEFQSGKFIEAADIEEAGEYPVYGGNGLRGYCNKYNHDGDYALIGRQGALCGNMNYSCGKAYFTEHAVAVKANAHSNTRFLYYLLEKMNLGQYSDQSAQPGLAVRKLLKLQNMFPSKPEQDKIGEFLTGLDDTITLHKREIEEEQRKKNVLMQLLLTGMVRV